MKESTMFMYSFIAKRIPSFVLLSVLLCLSLLLTSCSSDGGCYKGYLGPRRDSTETSLVVAWLGREGNPRWYEDSPIEAIYITSVDGIRWGPWTGAEKVCVLPGQRAFEVETKHHWEENASVMEHTQDSSSDDRSYRIKLSHGTSSWPFYCERRWLITIDIELGAEYRIIRGAIDQPPEVCGYRVGDSSFDVITTSIRPYFYSIEKDKWYLE